MKFTALTNNRLSRAAFAHLAGAAMGRGAARRQAPARAAAAADVLEGRRMLSGQPIGTSVAPDGAPPLVGIIGGQSASIEDYPYFVSIQQQVSGETQSHFCGGSLVEADWVLTAAHCNFQVGDIVRAGGSDLRVDTGTQFRTVVEVINHPDFTSTLDALYNDVALLRLDSPFELNERVQTVDFATPEDAAFFAPGDTATAVGHGTRFFGGSVSNRLQEVDIPIVTVAAANASGSYNGAITQVHLPAGTTNQDTSQGDSGGPLIVLDANGDPIVAGITSFGFSGGRAEFPGIYTRVSEFAGFIRNTLDENSDDASISGTVFEDSNRNGVQDPGEEGLPGLEVFIDENGDGVRGKLVSEQQTFEPVGIEQPVVIPEEAPDDPLDPENTPADWLGPGETLYNSTLFFDGFAIGFLNTANITESIPIPVTADGEIEDVEISFDFNTGDAEAFQFFLTSPDGVSIRLFGALGIDTARDGVFDNTARYFGPLTGSTTLSQDATTSVLLQLDNIGFFNTLDGTFIPDQSLDVFQGADPNGTWSLDVVVRGTGETTFPDPDPDDDVDPLPLPEAQPFVIDDVELTIQTVVDGSEPGTRTDAEGNYSFENLPPGVYDVTVVDPFNGFEPTRPPTLSRLVSVDVAANVDQDFGLARTEKSDGFVGFDSRVGTVFAAQTNGTRLVNSVIGRIPNYQDLAVKLIGDFDGDGVDDLVTREATSDRFTVRLGGAEKLGFPRDFGNAEALEDLSVGDFNGDGRDDLVGRRASTGNYIVYFSDGLSFTADAFGALPITGATEYFFVGDVNVDGRNDIIAQEASTGIWYTGIAQPSTFTARRMTRWNPRVEYSDVGIADFNGDGRSDLYGRIERSGRLYVGQAIGGRFDMMIAGQLNPQFDYDGVVVGDFDGDGRDQIISRQVQTGNVLISTPRGRQLVTEIAGNLRGNFVDAQVLDLNQDGLADYVARNDTTGVWQGGVSDGVDLSFRRWTAWSTRIDWEDVQPIDFSRPLPTAPPGGGGVEDDDKLDGLNSLMASSDLGSLLDTL